MSPTIKVCCALSILFFLSPIASAQTRRAVLVGIDTYEPPDPPASDSAANRGASRGMSADLSPSRASRGVWVNLKGSINDVTAMQQVIEKFYGFDDKNVHVLTDRQATRENIKNALQKYLIDEAAGGDIVFFYYAGHGSQMRNSKSRETPPKDETIVPADASQGVWDVRDKEFARWFNQMLDKKLLVTAIFDSCHSGSIARGASVLRQARLLPDDDRDADDDYHETAPEDRGALIFSAAQANQSAWEDYDQDSGPKPIPHGAFTLALLRVINAGNANLPAIDIFKAVKAQLQAHNIDQLPVLAGRGRDSKPLFGTEASGPGGSVRVAALDVSGERVSLDGGLAIGLREGAELRLTNSKKGSAQVRLRVTEAVSLSRSVAKVIEGDAEAAHPGDLFEVDKWATGAAAKLRVWMPPAALPQADVLRIAQDMSKLSASLRWNWIQDPTDSTAKNLSQTYWDGQSWVLSKPTGATVRLGAAPARQLRPDSLTGGPGAAPSFFLSLPPTNELTSSLQLGTSSVNSAVEVTSNRELADYLLVGRLNGKQLEYAWVLPNSTQDSNANSPNPVRTDWIGVGDTEKSAQAAAVQLTENALRLARVHGWLNLSAPPGATEFPYKLALKRSDCAAGCRNYKAEGSVIEGEQYGAVLTADPNNLKPYIPPRWVYVFILDSWGRGQLLFPPVSAGNEEKLNRLPVKLQDKWPEEISLSDPTALTVSCPFGVDTYILLTTNDPINDLSVFQFSGARSRGTGVHTGGNPLEDLLGSMSSNTRGGRIAVQANWSIQKLPLRSVPKSSRSANEVCSQE